MNESKFSKHIRGIIKSACGGHVSRVEAAESAAGIPDLDYCVHGREGHIELKVGSVKKPPDLLASQVRWFRKRIEAGGDPFFLCLNTDNNAVYLVDGQFFQQLSGKTDIATWGLLADHRWHWGTECLHGLKSYL